MSDFLNFVDEIIDGTPKYNVTDNLDGTKSIELANEIVQEGTALNRFNLHKIDSVMGYNECTNELVPVYTPKNYANADFNEIVPNWTSTKGTLNNNEITGTLNTINDDYLGAYTPTYKITNTAGIDFYNDTTSSDSQIRIYCRDGSSTNYTTASRFLSVLNTKNIENTHIVYFLSGALSARANKVIYEFDYKQNQTNKIIDFSLENTQNYSTEYATIYVSNDGIDYTLLEEKSLYRSSSRIYQEYSINIGTYRYCKIELSHTSTNISINYLKTQIQTYELLNQNQISTNVTNNYINNQRILIETPNYNISSIASNTIDDILCDTILKPSTKYELIYKEDTNKFELCGLLTLFDITLSEAVTQVDLTGISDMLKDDKLYELLIDGAGSSVQFGDNIIGYLESNARRNVVLLFKSSTYNNDKYIYGVFGSNSSLGGNATYNNSKITNYEFLQSSFQSGVHIIIKEVA